MPSVALPTAMGRDGSLTSTSCSICPPPPLAWLASVDPRVAAKDESPSRNVSTAYTDRSTGGPLSGSWGRATGLDGSLTSISSTPQ